MEKLANAIYNITFDMDFIDHAETLEKDMENLLQTGFTNPQENSL